MIIRPESIQNLRLRGEISDVSRIVQSDGKYLALVKLQSLPAQSQLTPGMTGKVSILAYENAAALLVPESAVFQDDFSEKPDPYVWVQATADAEPAKRFVKLGHRKEKQVEILEGLKAGDEILKSPPPTTENDSGRICTPTCGCPAHFRRSASHRSMISLRPCLAGGSS